MEPEVILIRAANFQGARKHVFGKETNLKTSGDHSFNAHLSQGSTRRRPAPKTQEASAARDHAPSQFWTEDYTGCCQIFNVHPATVSRLL